MPPVITGVTAMALDLSNVSVSGTGVAGAMSGLTAAWDICVELAKEAVTLIASNWYLALGFGIGLLGMGIGLLKRIRRL